MGRGTAFGQGTGCRAGPGDISRDEYREQATYAFNQVLQEVLNPPEE